MWTDRVARLRTLKTRPQRVPAVITRRSLTPMLQLMARRRQVQSNQMKRLMIAQIVLFVRPLQLRVYWQF